MTTSPAAEAGTTRIASAQQALAVAAELSESFAVGAPVRDACRELPYQQVQQLKRSGLLALPVPADYGGIDAPATVLAEVFRLLGQGDPSLAQIPHSHFTFSEALRLEGSHEQKALFLLADPRRGAGGQRPVRAGPAPDRRGHHRAGARGR